MTREQLLLRKVEAWERWDAARTRAHAATAEAELAYAAWYAAWQACEETVA